MRPAVPPPASIHVRMGAPRTTSMAYQSQRSSMPASWTRTTPGTASPRRASNSRRKRRSSSASPRARTFSATSRSARWARNTVAVEPLPSAWAST